MKLTIDQILNQAITAHKGSKFEEAEQLYKNILKAQPQNPDANHNLGVLKVSFNKSAEALPFFKTAIAVNPNIGQFWASYIDALLKENQLEEAEISCRKAIELEPDNSELYYSLAITLQNSGKLEESRTIYKKALNLDSSDKRIKIGYGKLLLKLNENKNGLKILSEGQGVIVFEQSGVKII